MKVSVLLEKLQRLETEGRGQCDLYVTPTIELCHVSHRPGNGIVVEFDSSDYPVEAVDDTYSQPEDADIVFLTFGMPD
ncbi:hypothetical protein [Virgisporangium aurantiacum]|uniref:Uncharacterized protein n=1 Tax=Virgisporangium aurantiacum TaxID=175570 RepID=A0A8J4DZW5_9ACTN|nr:hypothetical protein [Virgisporangium aurantiacum]GIJ56379.1 hypothetical protein Vau01_038950 [Virgisporangium aurantiacum]